MLDTQTIRLIRTDHPRVHAFRLHGSAGAAEIDGALRSVDEASARHDDRLRLLLVLEGSCPAGAIAALTLEGLHARLRAPTEIERYALVGAPVAARRLIEAARATSPIDARTFDRAAEGDAWAFVGARPRG